MSTISVSEARAALRDIPEGVHAGEEVTITRYGEAVAVVLRPDTLRARRGAARRTACAPATPSQLATAVSAGAERFITNNASDFAKTISELEVVYPSELPEHHPDVALEKRGVALADGVYRGSR